MKFRAHMTFASVDNAINDDAILLTFVCVCVFYLKSKKKV